MVGLNAWRARPRFEGGARDAISNALMRRIRCVPEAGMKGVSVLEKVRFERPMVEHPLNSGFHTVDMHFHTFSSRSHWREGQSSDCSRSGGDSHDSRMSLRPSGGAAGSFRNSGPATQVWTHRRCDG